MKKIESTADFQRLNVSYGIEMCAGEWAEIE